MVSVKFFAVFVFAVVFSSALAAPHQKRDTSDWTSEQHLENLKDAIDANNEVIEEALDFSEDGEDEELAAFPFYKNFGDATQKAVKRTEADAQELYDSIEKQVKQGEAFPSVEDIDKSYETILLKNSEKLKSELHNAIQDDEIVNSSPELRKGIELFIDSYATLSYKYFGVLFHEEITHPEEIAVIDDLDVDDDDIVSEDGELNAKAIEAALEKKHVSKETHDKVLALVNELSTILKQFKADIEKAGEKITENLGIEEK